MSVNLAVKAETYPALSEMGIHRFHEISHYSLRQHGDSKDTLRVYYKRAKGSLLPYSRKYKFGRAIKTVIVDGGTARMEQVYEISPFLQKAVVELDGLVVANKLVVASVRNVNALINRKAELLAEINSLEGMLADAVSPAAASDAVARFIRVRKHIEAL